jgi:hypothetical protein
MDDLDAADHALGCGAQLDVIFQCFRSILSFFLGQFKEILNVDMRYFQNTVDIFYIAGYDCLILVFKAYQKCLLWVLNSAFLQPLLSFSRYPIN